MHFVLVPCANVIHTDYHCDCIAVNCKKEDLISAAFSLTLLEREKMIFD